MMNVRGHPLTTTEVMIIVDVMHVWRDSSRVNRRGLVRLGIAYHRLQRNSMRDLQALLIRCLIASSTTISSIFLMLPLVFLRTSRRLFQIYDAVAALDLPPAAHGVGREIQSGRASSCISQNVGTKKDDEKGKMVTSGDGGSSDELMKKGHWC